MEQWIAVGGVLGAIVCGVIAYLSREQVRAMTTTETVSVDELKQLHRAAVEAGGPGSFRYTCEVVGMVRPGPDGPSKSELAGVRSVWHKHRVTRKYTQSVRSGNRRRQQTRNEVVTEATTASPFRVKDATGAVLVDPGNQDPDGVEKVRDRFERDRQGGGGKLTIGSFSLRLPSRSRTIGYRYEEWALRPGRQVYVLGEASDQSGRLTLGAPAEGGVFLISTRSEAELRSRERTKVLGFSAGGAAALLAGLIAAAFWIIG